MIPRYSTPEMTAVWSDVAKFARWLEVELLATEAHAAIGVVPADAAAACRAGAPAVDEHFVAAVLEREAVTDHDVAAFVDVVQQAIGDAGKWIHYGLTSSDVGDTTLCWQMRDAADLLVEAASALLETLDRTGSAAPRHGDDRTHARDPCRADDVRCQGRAVGTPGRSRSHAPCRRRAGRWRS